MRVAIVGAGVAGIEAALEVRAAPTAGDGMRMGRARRGTVTLLLVLAGGCALVTAVPTFPPTLLSCPMRALHPGVRWLTTDALSAMLLEPDAPVLLDARSADEFDVSHIRGARRIDPEGPFTDLVASERPIVVYCSVGWRSALAIEAMPPERAAHVLNLDGGLFAWANEGRELVRGERRVRDVHPYDRFWALFLAEHLRAYAARETS